MKAVAALPIAPRTITLKQWSKQWPKGQALVPVNTRKPLHLQIDDATIVSLPVGQFKMPPSAASALLESGLEIEGYVYKKDPPAYPQTAPTRSPAQAAMAGYLGHAANLSSMVRE